MALSIFADALPYSEIHKNYITWFPDIQIAGLLPNIAYSSSLHWQLYCDKYPDERGVLLDWKKVPETNKAVRIISTILKPIDQFRFTSLVAKKIFDRFIFRENVFANIPLKFRKYFSCQGQYLFWEKSIYNAEPIFDGYAMVSQDEGHIDFESAIKKLNTAIDSGNPNIFFNTGFADSIGHQCERGELYSKRIEACMEMLHDSIERYCLRHPAEEVLIISDHGMSTVKGYVDYPLASLFGKQSIDTYIVYTDSCFMCIWCKDVSLRKEIESYLSDRKEGHLMTTQERIDARATNPIFGDIIYILKEGRCFSNNWFGKSIIKRPDTNGIGMHGFWPEWGAIDQVASVVLIHGKRKLDTRYTYKTANLLIKEVMSHEN